MSVMEERDQRLVAAPIATANLRAGRSPTFADIPVMRVAGPMNFIVDVHGVEILHSDKRHPLNGQGKRIRPWLDYGAELGLESNHVDL